jgi:hypothetical protein
VGCADAAMSTLRGPSSKWAASGEDGRASRLARVVEDAFAEGAPPNDAAKYYHGDKPSTLFAAPARATDRQARCRPRLGSAAAR